MSQEEWAAGRRVGFSNGWRQAMDVISEVSSELIEVNEVHLAAAIMDLVWERLAGEQRKAARAGDDEDEARQAAEFAAAQAALRATS